MPFAHIPYHPVISDQTSEDQKARRQYAYKQLKIIKFRRGNFRLSLKMQLPEEAVQPGGVMKQGNVCLGKDLERKATRLQRAVCVT